MKYRGVPNLFKVLGGITADILKVEIETTAKHFEKLFNIIWEKEGLLSDWNKGLIVKIPKTGERAVCDNYGGITITISTKYSLPQYHIHRIQRVEKSKEKNKLALGREEALLNNCLLYITSLNCIVENGTHLFT